MLQRLILIITWIVISEKKIQVFLGCPTGFISISKCYCTVVCMRKNEVVCTNLTGKQILVLQDYDLKRLCESCYTHPWKKNLLRDRFPTFSGNVQNQSHVHWKKAKEFVQCMTSSKNSLTIHTVKTCDLLNSVKNLLK